MNTKSTPTQIVRLRYLGTFGLPLSKTFATQGEALQWIIENGLGARSIEPGGSPAAHRVILDTIPTRP